MNKTTNDSRRSIPTNDDALIFSVMYPLITVGTLRNAVPQTERWGHRTTHRLTAHGPVAAHRAGVAGRAPIEMCAVAYDVTLESGAFLRDGEKVAELRDGRAVLCGSFAVLTEAAFWEKDEPAV